MQIVELNIGELKPYKENPRINDNAIDAVAASIAEFGFKVPIIIDKDNVIIAGHTRLKAAQKLGLESVPVIRADDLTPEQVKAFRLVDNKTAELAEWDFEKLNAELAELSEMDMSQFGFEEIESETKSWGNDGNPGALEKSYIIPPFSVLNCAAGYWQDRKKQWFNIGIDSGEGRDEDLIDSGLYQLAQSIGRNVTGTSIFDPVLAELMYKWFNVEGGSVLDCFAGGSVRGIVAEYLGYKYTGVDLSAAQIEANRKQAAELDLAPNWIIDDSRNIDKYADNDSFDMIFSCPPYFDLERYSDDEKDLSAMTWDDFKTAYGEIITATCKKLKPDRFAVFVVGDIRDKKGFLRNFPDYTKECFENAGLHFYNEMILYTQLCSAPIRAAQQFKNRKVVKVHQNILVYYKGDPQNIKTNYTNIESEIQRAIAAYITDIAPDRNE